MLPEFKMKIIESCVNGEKCKMFRLLFDDKVVGLGATTLLNYNGATQTIRSSTNVTSVTYSSTGRYVVNFTSAYAKASPRTNGSA